MKIRVALAQINVTVGDVPGNKKKILAFLRQAERVQPHIVAFPELAVTGYPPEDLLFRSTFIRENLAVARQIASQTGRITALFGFAGQDRKGNLTNAMAIASNGKLVARYDKMKLPNYGVFDEKRYFTSGVKPMILEDRKTKTRCGVSVCEDIWTADSPCREEAQAGARILFNISASPYHAGKRHVRERLLTHRAREYRSWICYTNLVGGQDELVFDGGSLVINPGGKIIFRAPQFKEGLFLVEIPLRERVPVVREKEPVSVVPLSWRSKTSSRSSLSDRSAQPLSTEAEIFEALVLGLRDYVRKNGFSHVVVGLSGGIDSALTAAIAVAALGKGAVTGVSMPSRYSSRQTQADSKAVAKNLGIAFLEIPIERTFQAFSESLRPTFHHSPPDITEENLQARIRGVLLMALSNKFHWLVLATGNKSELSTGYCTLYGDMVGGFAVIKDVPKTLVYKISHYANQHFGRAVIPSSTFARPPTAELKPNQKDQDTLPPYDRLDRVVKAYVEENLSASDIRTRVKAPRTEIEQVLRMIDRNEYKRRQAPIGIKITPKAFGKDRRMPITNSYHDI